MRSNPQDQILRGEGRLQARNDDHPEQALVASAHLQRSSSKGNVQTTVRHNELFANGPKITLRLSSFRSPTLLRSETMPRDGMKSWNRRTRSFEIVCLTQEQLWECPVNTQVRVTLRVHDASSPPSPLGARMKPLFCHSTSLLYVACTYTACEIEIRVCGPTSPVPACLSESHSTRSTILAPTRDKLTWFFYYRKCDARHGYLWSPFGDRRCTVTK